MTPLRKKRLMVIAGTPCDHKPYYSQYLELMKEGLIGWTFGWAYRTESGEEWIKERALNAPLLFNTS